MINFEEYNRFLWLLHSLYQRKCDLRYKGTFLGFLKKQIDLILYGYQIMKNRLYDAWLYILFGGVCDSLIHTSCKLRYLV